MADEMTKDETINALEADLDELRKQLAAAKAENEKLERENNQLLDTLIAAGFIGDGTQIIGDKRYEELVKAELDLRETNQQLAAAKKRVEELESRIVEGKDGEKAGNAKS